MAHAVDKMVLPATRTLADILAHDAQFSTFARVLEEAGLMGKLGELPGQLTVFAPTNAAFDRLDAETREKVRRRVFLIMILKPILRGGIHVC